MREHEIPQLLLAANGHAPAANTAAVVTLAATAARAHVLSQIIWSYDGDPTGGSLTISIGGVALPSFAITSGGPGFLTFWPPIKGHVNEAIVVTLAAGGAGVTGNGYAHAWKQ